MSNAVLGSASENGQVAVAKLLLATDGVEVESKENDGLTPMQRAAQNGYEAILQLLLERGAELDSRDREQQTPLSWAAQNGHAAVVKLLLENRVLEPMNREQWTPLLWAAPGAELSDRLAFQLTSCATRRSF